MSAPNGFGHIPPDPTAALTAHDLLATELRANRTERREQTAAFREALETQTKATQHEFRALREQSSRDFAGLRTDVRVFAVVALLVIAALAGVQVSNGVGPGTLSIATASAGEP